MAAQTISGELAQTYRQIEALVMLTKCLPLRHPLPPMRGFAVSPDLALLLYELVHEHHPSLVVECGSGVSSLVIGYALKVVGAGHLISFEHDARAAERSLALVGRHGLERQVQIVHAGLQETHAAGESWKWYGPEVEETLVGKRARLVFIDGPYHFQLSPATCVSCSPAWTICTCRSSPCRPTSATERSAARASCSNEIRWPAPSAFSAYPMTSDDTPEPHSTTRLGRCSWTSS